MRERCKVVIKYQKPSHGRMRTMYRTFDNPWNVEMFIDYLNKKGWPWSAYRLIDMSEGRR